MVRSTLPEIHSTMFQERDVKRKIRSKPPTLSPPYSISFYSQNNAQKCQSRVVSAIQILLKGPGILALNVVNCTSK